MNNFFGKIKNQDGAIALITIVVIAAAVLIMAYNASLLGMGEMEIGYIDQKGGETYSIAEGCVEETLRRIRLDNTYGVGAGEINLSIGANSCIINVNQSGGSRTIYATSTVENYHKVIKTDITLTGANIISINSWQEQ